MNKKLLTAAVGAALVAAPMLAAQADVKVYGHIQFEIANEEVTDLPSTPSGGTGDTLVIRTNRWNGFDNSVITFEDNQRGRFGIKADEDLGGGLKGFAKIEYDISTDAQESSFGASPGIREANVGLAGAFGSITLGTQKTPYKYMGGVTYDQFVTTNLEARRNGGMTGGSFGHNAFASNAIGYETPKGMPVKVWAVFSPDENSAGAEGVGTNDWDKGDYSIGVSIGDKMWEAFAVTNKNKSNQTDFVPPLPATTTDDDYTATKVGGKFQMGNHTFLGQYEMADTDAGAGGANFDLEATLLFLAYHLKMGNTTLVAQIADGTLEAKGSTLDDQEWTYWTVGAVHKFSKTTRVFGGYTKTDVKNYNGIATADGDRTALSIGLRKDF